MSAIHLIQIPDKEERKKAIEAFLDVPKSWVRLPGFRMGVTQEHVDALNRSKIEFKYLSNAPSAQNHASKTD